MAKVNKALLVKQIMQAATGDKTAFEYIGEDFKKFPNFRKVTLTRNLRGFTVELGSVLFAGEVYADYNEVINYIENNKDTILDGYRVEIDPINKDTALLKIHCR